MLILLLCRNLFPLRPSCLLLRTSRLPKEDTPATWMMMARELVTIALRAALPVPTVFAFTCAAAFASSDSSNSFSSRCETCCWRFKGWRNCS